MERVRRQGQRQGVRLPGPGRRQLPPGVTREPRDETAHGHAPASPGAETAGCGLGKSGWVRIPLEERGAPPAEPLCDWAEEGYRAIAPKRLMAELDVR